MSLADQIEAYVDALAHFGPAVAFHGCAFLMARDSASHWEREEN